MCKQLLKHGLIVMLTFCTTHVLATDLGVIGTTFPIIEPDLLEVIQSRLWQIQTNGKINEIEQKLDQSIRDQWNRPSKVDYVTRVEQSRKYLFDPSVRVTNDLRDSQGHIMIAAGRLINPLNYYSLNEALVFFDGESPAQVKRVEEIDAHYQGRDKLILINGSVNENSAHFHRQVYFDQNGILSKRFQLQHVPTVITQQNHQLLIEEVQP